jgi:hypothetical protein
MDVQSECQKLAARFATMSADGLLDVKFYMKNTDEVESEALCREVNLMYEAVDCGEEQPLDFGDASRR